MSRRLDAVLRVRALREQLARADIAAEQAALAEHLDSEREAWAYLHSISGPGVVTSQQLARHRSLLQSSLSTAERSGERVMDGRRRVGTATALWQEDAQRLDGAERLAERHAEAERLEADRLERAAIDDFVVTRWPITSAASSVSRPSASHTSASDPSVSDPSVPGRSAAGPSMARPESGHPSTGSTS